MTPELERAEWLMRGEALSYSSFIESCLAQIIILAKGSTPTSEGVDFKALHFKDKVKVAIDAIRLVDARIHEENRLFFEELNHLHFRHRMAHCPIYWDEKDLSYFTIWEFSLNGKESGPVPVVYSLVEANEEIKRLASICDKLQSILAITANDFENKTNYLL